jgi:hypothetical protein
MPYLELTKYIMINGQVSRSTAEKLIEELIFQGALLRKSKDEISWNPTQSFRSE